MTLKESLMNIKDFRIDRCKKHNLCDILMIVLIGYLTGCKNIEEIHFSAEVCEDTLRKYLELPNGIPSADTILRVLAGIDGKELEKVLAVYARGTFGSLIPEKEVMAIDGKTIRRSGYTNHNDASKSHKAAHGKLDGNMLRAGQDRGEIERDNCNPRASGAFGNQRAYRYD